MLKCLVFYFILSLLLLLLLLLFLQSHDTKFLSTSKVSLLMLNA
jgi:hypothetical protein